MFPKKYDFHLTEKNKRTNYWKRVIENTFNNFSGTLLLPPPNITGNLHLGHAFEAVIQDFLVRFSHLDKKPIYWIAGIDHAGISTQSKIEKLNLLELKTNQQKRDYTLQIWYPQTRKIFYQQWEKLGLLIDYEKASFTLDPLIQKQVREAFVKLYQDGLIYRGVRLVNWDPKLQSVISDIEVDHKATTSKLYYLKYPLQDSDDYLLVATSRPETIFSDVALFVNPHDERYKKYLNWSTKHPLTGKTIPILSDKSIKMDFGSGVLKCTPGHDFSDYQLGKKYQLPIISCCDEKGILNELAGQWQGQEINSIREEFVAKLVEKGICVKIEEYETNLAYSSKSGVIIEPLLSQQWFLDLPTLIKKAEEKQPNFLAQIDFITSQFRKVLEDWCAKVHDWCISRQLWWGHRIPAWYHKSSGEIYVGTTPPPQEKEWKAENDVLDTWFSSGLWPLVVRTKEGEKFPATLSNCYPISTLITGYDILFFWVLKMILLGTYFTGQVPFQQVLLHGLIRDKHGKKMSKSLGNGVEPDALIEKYGCDSLRLFLLENNIWGSDLIYNEYKVIGSWRFCQKLWSIANLINSKISTTELRKVEKRDLKKGNSINDWILNELATLQNSYFTHLEKKEINFAAAQLIKFTREKLSNEYLELIKISPWDTNTKNTLLFVYQQLLTMLHPAIPFITEHIYQEITQQEILSRKIEKVDIKTENNNLWQVDCLIILLSNIRNFRQKSRVSKFYLELISEWEKKINHSFDFNYYLKTLAKSKISILEKEKKDSFSSFIDLQPFGTLWYQEQIGKEELEEQLKHYEKEGKRSKQLLENKNFLKKAPFQLVEEEKKKLDYYEKQKQKLLTKLENLN